MNNPLATDIATVKNEGFLSVNLNVGVMCFDEMIAGNIVGYVVMVKLDMLLW